MRPNAFSGFGDEKEGFYSVFTILFTKIKQSEIDAYSHEHQHKHLHSELPVFGSSQTSIEDVLAFYEKWQ